MGFQFLANFFGNRRRKNLNFWKKGNTPKKSYLGMVKPKVSACFVSHLFRPMGDGRGGGGGENTRGWCERPSLKRSTVPIKVDGGWRTRYTAFWQKEVNIGKKKKEPRGKVCLLAFGGGLASSTH